ncbi:MAG: AroM family protein [Candidatus Aminicenantales bacterium]
MIMTAPKKVGFLTIGQSPRDDILTELIPFFPEQLEILQAGALDGLSRGEIEVLAPENQEFPLISRLRDGSQAVVGRQKILPRLKGKLRELEIRGADIIVVLCTEDFPELSSKKHLILPFELMKSEMERRRGIKKITVVVPLKAQENAAIQKWTFPAGQTKIIVLNPYATPKEHESDVQDFFGQISGYQPDLLIFDCLGFTISLSRKIGQIIRLPFISPRLSLAHCLKQLI